ncbi:unnamed protein product [Ostreobium quekettii]|uniref:Autophagy-related protein 9 n=1 Tax=Ostreobium quekettii TaxID=121088 RepID=A0A8S1ILJ1_9CHLO|nr:unnamed protein product [Ostreobium quekettii]|eukprot:evm.model.scf_57.11 EVM.evm.TU.scf_57.11   scf_57:94697-98887(-)
MSAEEESGLPADLPYERLPGLPEDEIDTPELAGAESYEWEAHSNLDSFFTRIYRYWQGKGFYTIILREILNLIALLFTVAFSGLLLLFLDWGALSSPCTEEESCDVVDVIIKHNPMVGASPLMVGLKLLYLAIFSLYWLWTLALFLFELPGLLDVKRLCNYRMGISERQIKWLSWPELVHRLVRVQHKTRLCNVRDLSEHDIIMRIMRRENYLIGMLNKGVLALNVPFPGYRRQFLLTKTLEWNIYWCILNAMFDDNFRVKEHYKHDVPRLQRRFRTMAVANLLLAPFVFVFLVIYFLLKNVEKFYHSPGTIGARSWTPLARWRLREFNEMEHFVDQRLAASTEDATKYVDQFPSYSIAHVMNLVTYVLGSFTALLLLIELMDASLDRKFMGKSVWYFIAIFTVFLNATRGLVQKDEGFDPEGAMAEVVKHTHYLPRHWRGRAHSKEVQEQFQRLFQFKAQIFLNELASVILTPFVLYYSLPGCAESILEFIAGYTIYERGVGDTCSLASFDFRRHGNTKYGATVFGERHHRSKQGKMEKSFLSFVTLYPSWSPSAAGEQFLSNLLPYGPPTHSQYASQYSRPPCNNGGPDSAIGGIGLGNFGGPGAVGNEGKVDIAGAVGADVDAGAAKASAVHRRKGRRSGQGRESSSCVRGRQDGIEMSGMSSSLLAVGGSQVEGLGRFDEDGPLGAPSSAQQGGLEGDIEQQGGELAPSLSKTWGPGGQELVPPPPENLTQSLQLGRGTGGAPVHPLSNSFDSWSASQHYACPDAKLIESHWTLQNYYHGHDETVQHRLAYRMSQLGGPWEHLSRAVQRS